MKRFTLFLKPPMMVMMTTLPRATWSQPAQFPSKSMVLQVLEKSSELSEHSQSIRTVHFAVLALGNGAFL